MIGRHEGERRRSRGWLWAVAVGLAVLLAGAAIEAWMKSTPRALVEVERGQGGGLGDRGLLELVRGELTNAGKLEVVASDAERKAMHARLARVMADPSYRDGMCEVGTELPPNSVIRAGVAGGRLYLKLLSLERGCLVQSVTVPWSEARARPAVAEAVGTLVSKLRQPPVMPWGSTERPPAPKTSAPVGAAGSPGGGTQSVDYAALAAEAEAAKRAADEAARRAAEAEARAAEVRAARAQAWVAVSKYATTSSMDRGKRAAALEAFLRDFPDGNPHAESARSMIAALRAGEEPEGGGSVGEWVYSTYAKLWFTRSEVTVAEYLACVRDGKCDAHHLGGYERPGQAYTESGYCNAPKAGERGDHPMNCVSATQADAYCAWLGGALPSEDAWYAEASAGETRKYPWGSEAASCDRAVMAVGDFGCGRKSTWPVCWKRRGDSASGLCDMSGNVDEWVKTTDRSVRVTRGGSWRNADSRHLAASARYRYGPTDRYGDVGFRCARVSRPGGGTQSVDYAALAAEADAAKRAADEAARRAAEVREARAEAREKAWVAVSKYATTSSMDRGKRAAALEAFLRDFPDDNPHAESARSMIAALRAGKEPEGGGSVWEWVYSKYAKLWFTRAEVTVAQYLACVKAGKCPKDSYEGGGSCNADKADRGDHPMNCVRATGADAFCAWVGGELPSEEAWYAEASAGGTHNYPWGSEMVSCDRAVWGDWGDGPNTDGCGRKSTWPVCSKRRGDSASGLCDMSGNVWEWTKTTDGSVRQGGWRALFGGAVRVIRGGAWSCYHPHDLIASARSWFDPAHRGYSLGFRCARVSRP